jgi:CubicO group peptidase (beta-lactamase class C family)
MMSSSINVNSLILTLIFFLCQGSFCFLEAQAAWPTQEWERSTPEEEGIKPNHLIQIIKEKKENNKYEYLHSIIIIKNGYLVFEEYFNGFSAEKSNLIQSVTKSFTSALIGMAIEQEHIEGVDERILDFFPELVDINNIDDRKRSMTLEDILTMRTGTDYEEGYDESPHNQLNRLKTGWDTFYLNRPMIRDPGLGFQYDSGGVILLSAMLKNRSGMHVDAYAKKYLFPPLGIKQVLWMTNDEGHPHTGGGLFLRPLDMAKFGLLYLKGGMWEGQQLIPANWVKASFSKHHSFGSPGSRKITDYGYLWWIMEGDPDGEENLSIYAARGYGGQYIFIIPEHDMIVVTTSNWINPSGGGDPVDILYNEILPSLHD